MSRSNQNINVSIVADSKAPLMFNSLFYLSDPTRSNDWDNIVTCHSGSRIVPTWRLQNKCIGKHTLGKELDKLRESIATVRLNPIHFAS